MIVELDEEINSAADVRSQWMCSSDEDCSSLSGSVCNTGACVCRPGQQVVLRGSACVDISPYIESPCVEDHQCTRLFTGFECRKNNADTGACFCQEGYHYFLGRCWRSVDFGEPCMRSEECLGVFRDPFALTCQDTCQCSEGYYARQRGECRRFSTAPGDGCVLDSDCQFPRGVCDQQTFTCLEGPTELFATGSEINKKNFNITATSGNKMAASENKMVASVNEIAASGYKTMAGGNKMAASVNETATSVNEIAASAYKMLTSGNKMAGSVNKMAGSLNKMADSVNKMTAQRVVCSATNPCASPFQCSSFGVCICPTGYYESDDGSSCYAELGSPSTPEQCVGLLAVVINGICSCQPNFYYDENMKDCIRVTRQISESCVNDFNCHTFGAAAHCGPPQEPWGLRSCQCDAETSVWDESRQMCRYFAGVGESCEIDSDCLAGSLEITCVINDQGAGFCACPDNLVEVDGLCLTTGLGLGDTCQHPLECAVDNSVCTGVCSCAEGYRPLDGICAPIIGGSCEQDSDCAVEHTVCGGARACECRAGFVQHGDECLPGE
ncbi:unnamed protein product [Euphydryas editha]|uniref:EB domain-containing protein n=1 Tax=Euphydryas editha TaxID=104508 RepID=A0AAU9T7D6_EUPED|nr:unnamed protein product [Euphydryas editha]